jgi:hypothetical protein
MGFKASQRRSVPLDAPASQPSSRVAHSMSGFFSQTPYEPWCYAKDCETAMLSEHDMDSTTSAIGVGKILDRRVQRTTPRRSIHHTREKGAKFCRTWHAPSWAILRACMATPSYIHLRGQAVRVLCSRTLQTRGLVRTGGAKARQQMAGGGGEEGRGAKHRFQSSGCACVSCTTLICQGIEAKKVMAHRQQRGSMPLALQKGLLSARVWRTIDLASCLPGIWVPPVCTPATLL